MNYGYIYKTTNLVNNKPYIGQHRGEFNRTYLGSGYLIKRAVKKYGKDNFAVIMLGQALDKKSLDILEKYYIAFYRQLLGKDMLYNIAEGGEGGPTRIGYKTRKETREKIRLGNLGKKHSEEWNKNNSLSHLGKPRKHPVGCKCPFCKAKQGEYHPTQEAIEKTRLSNIGNTNVRGTVWIANNKLNTTKRVTPDMVDQYLSNGWVLGMGEEFSNRCKATDICRRLIKK